MRDEILFQNMYKYVDDIASYGLYVSRLEGLKKYAPAAGLPEIGLPRSRMLQLGLERFE